MEKDILLKYKMDSRDDAVKFLKRQNHPMKWHLQNFLLTNER